MFAPFKWSAWGLALSLTLGCQGLLPTGANRTAPKAIAKASPSPGAQSAVRPIPLESAQRLVGQGGQTVELLGQVKLLSEKGMGIISNNSGGLISNNGGGLISNNGGGLVGNNGGGLIANNAGGLTSQARAYGVLQAQEENLLADAQIEVLDAAGQVLVGPDKKPLTATTDQTGSYSFKATLPAENLVLRIRLYNGGQLFAFVTADASGAKRTIDIDTASSLGASFVLSRYVKKNQGVFNRLPETEAKTLNQALEKARGLLKTKAPSYTPEDLTSAADALQAQAPEVKASFERIEAILLAGQKDLGNGLPATEVALATPLAALFDARGEVLIAEMSGSRLRRVDDQGRLRMVAGSASTQAEREGQEALSAAIGGPVSLAYGPDGTLYFCDMTSCRVRKITPDGKLYTLAGNGQRAIGAVDVPATQTSLKAPAQLALGADGTLYFGETSANSQLDAARVLMLTPDGLLKALPIDGLDLTSQIFPGVAVEKDGTLWLISARPQARGMLLRRKPGAAWELMLGGLKTDSHARLALAPDGTVVFSEPLAHQVSRFDPQTGARQVVAGTGTAGAAGDGGAATAAQLNAPSGVSFKADGTLLIADTGNGLVRRVEPNGTIRTIAGTTGLTQTGEAVNVSINQPASLALDGQGRLVIAEVASNTLKRLDDKNLTVVAGTSKGYGGDDGPATSAQFDALAGIAYAGDVCYVLDVGNTRLRKIDADGTITTVAGGKGRGVANERLNAPDKRIFQTPAALAIGPEGLPYWTDGLNNQVLRLTKEGMVEVLAGSLAGARGDAGDGGPAAEALLTNPTGLAFDAQGNLYVADTGNLRVRKLDTQGRISTVAGLPAAMVAGKMLTGGLGGNDDGPAAQAVLLGPGSLAFDAAGNLYIGEAGTVNVSSLPSNLLGGMPTSMIPKVHARIRKLTPDGQIKTIAGPGTPLLNDPASDNGLRLPIALLIDREGRLIVADPGLNQVKLLPKGSF